MGTEGRTARESHAHPSHEDHELSLSKALIAGGSTALFVVVFAPLVLNSLSIVGYDAGLNQLLVASVLVGGIVSLLAQW